MSIQTQPTQTHLTPEQLGQLAKTCRGSTPQVEWAEQMGLSQSSVSKLESGAFPDLAATIIERCTGVAYNRQTLYVRAMPEQAEDQETPVVDTDAVNPTVGT